MSYTKGNWTIRDETQIFCGDRLVANAGGYADNYSSPRTENVANARLIALSPTMFEYINKKALAGDIEAQSIIKVRLINRRRSPYQRRYAR